MPNAIIFMSDEHTPAVSNVHGHPLAPTPNLERLAARGTVYEHAYCASPLCLPSRSAFISGHRVHELQTYSNCLLALPKDIDNMGRALSREGVYTAYFGCNFDVYDRPENLGFSEVFAERLRQYPGDCRIGRERTNLNDAAERASGFGPRSEKEAYGRDLLVMDKALTWLQETAPKLDQPWVLLINLHAPHFNYYTTPALWERFAAAADLPPYGRDTETARHPRNRDLQIYYDTERYTDDQIRGLRRAYVGSVCWVDQQLGRVMDALATQGMEDDTTLVYTSDHGVMRGEFGLWWKSSLHEGAARVPCVAAGPGFSVGMRTVTPVDLHDVQASLFRTTGAARPAQWVGAPLQDIPAHDPTRVVFCEYHGQGVTASSYLVRQDRWKLIWHANAPPQLFDLAQDPDETTNLADSQPDQLYAMEKLLRAICDPEAEDRRASEFIRHQRELAAALGTGGKR